ncbi:DNA translocase FtsK [candidate division KSB1 bacterium]
MRKRKSSKKRIIIGIITVAVALFLGLSVLTYNTTDPTTSPGADAKNVMGVFGAMASYFLINYTFGYAVLIPVVFLLLWGMNLVIRKPKTESLRIWSVYWFCITFLISFGLAIINEFSAGGGQKNYEFSGLIGAFFGSNSATYLGKPGTIILYFALLVILFVVWFNISFAKTVSVLDLLLGKFQNVKKNLFSLISARFSGFRRKQKIKTTLRRTAQRSKSFDIPLIRKQKSEKDEKIKITTRDESRLQETEIEDKRPITISVKKDPVPSKITQQEEESTYTNSGKYSLPPLSLLSAPETTNIGDTKQEIMQKAEILEGTLLDFGVQTKVTDVHPGPVLTLYEVRPDTGVKINRILSLQDDLALAMKAKGIRIMAPIPGKDTVGIEIPNQNQATVHLKSLINDPAYRSSAKKLTLALGKTVTGEVYTADLAKMPHILIAGSTGSGKSVGINSIITNILFAAKPSEVQFVMIDPKMLELSVFKKLKSHHLLAADFLDEEVITKPQNAVMALRSCVFEMEKRYELLAKSGVRHIDDYNAKKVKPVDPDSGEPFPPFLEKIVIIIDELADLMMVASKDVEEPIARLAQMARAVGIHMVLATQRPSVDVITGVIKANFPARMAFQVATKVDSRTILDMNGAEQLLGTGDMLYLPPGAPKPIRMQNAFVSLEEIDRVIDHVRSQPKFRKSTELALEKQKSSRDGTTGVSGDRDPLFSDAARIVVTHQQGSISLLQRRLKVGYSRAARLVDELEDAGVVGPYDGSKARIVLIEDEDDLEGII